MAAEVKSNVASNKGKGPMKKGAHRKPELINKLEGHSGKVNAACLIPGEDGVISVSDDR